MMICLLAAMQFGLHWADVKDDPAQKALMDGPFQIGIWCGLEGKYYPLDRVNDKWMESCDPPIPPPHANFGVREDKMQPAGALMRAGKPVTREELVALLKPKPKPLPLIPADATPYYTLAGCAGGIVVLALVMSYLRRRKFRGL